MDADLRRRDWLRYGAASLGAGALALATPGAQAEPTARRSRQGEAFTWSLRFLGVFEAGRARLAVTPAQKTANGWQIAAVGEAEALGLAKAFTGLHDDYRLVLDASTLAPRRIEIVETGFRSRTVTIQADGKRIEMVQHKPEPERRLSGTLPSEPLEPVSVLLQLRGARLKDGDHLELIILDGTALYQGSIDVQGREELTTAFGTHQAIKLLCKGERVDQNGHKGGRPARTATMWLSDDARRLPLLVVAQTDLGSGQFELTGYDAGARALPTPKNFTGITQTSGAPAASPVNRPATPPAPRPAVPQAAPSPVPQAAPPAAAPSTAAAVPRPMPTSVSPPVAPPAAAPVTPPVASPPVVPAAPPVAPPAVVP